MNVANMCEKFSVVKRSNITEKGLNITENGLIGKAGKRKIAVL